jgi:hypothetical protein
MTRKSGKLPLTIALKFMTKEEQDMLRNYILRYNLRYEEQSSSRTASDLVSTSDSGKMTEVYAKL